MVASFLNFFLFFLTRAMHVGAGSWMDHFLGGNQRQYILGALEFQEPACEL